MKFADKKVKEFLSEVASKNPTPGGGSVAAVSGATAASLVEMVANLSEETKEIKKIKILALDLRRRLLKLADDDAVAFNGVMKAFKIPKERSGRKMAIQLAFKKAAEVPLSTAEESKKILDLAKQALKIGNKNASSDAKVAIHLSKASIKSAVENVKINLKYIKDKKFILQCEKKLSGLG